jgi:ABC-type oligopeptide transport system substrate-binding subunit
MGLVWLRMNTRRGPLREAKVRRSIAAALARPLWNAAPPRCWPLPVEGDQLRLPAPATSRADLAKGHVLELLVLADPEREQQGALVQSVLLQHGVTVEITPLESKTLCGRISRGDYDFCLTSWMADSAGPEEMLLPWCDASKAGNATGWGSAEVARCIVASRQTGSTAPLSLAARIVEAAAPVVPLAGLEWRYWAGPQMAHWAVTPIGSYDWISAGFLPSEEDHRVDWPVPGIRGDQAKLVTGPSKSD